MAAYHVWRADRLPNPQASADHNVGLSNTNRVSAIRLHIYRTAIYRISLLYDDASTVRKRTVKTVIRRILQIRERIADLS